MPVVARSEPLALPVRPRNDPEQYDDLADQWWAPRGAFAMLHWIAAARAELVPAARRAGSVLLDVACGGGVLAPHVRDRGHRHLGVDLSAAALLVAREHGVVAVRGDAAALPLPDGSADVVVAGEVLEHVPDLPRVVAELTRVLAPGGTLVLDSIAATAWGRFTSVSVAERLPGGPPRRLHDPGLFVDRDELVREASRGGVTLTLSGLLPSAPAYLAWVLGRRHDVPLRRIRSTAGLFAAVGVKGHAAGVQVGDPAVSA